MRRQQQSVYLRNPRGLLSDYHQGEGSSGEVVRRGRVVRGGGVVHLLATRKASSPASMVACTRCDAPSAALDSGTRSAWDQRRCFPMACAAAVALRPSARAGLCPMCERVSLLQLGTCIELEQHQRTPRVNSCVTRESRTVGPATLVSHGESDQSHGGMTLWAVVVTHVR